MHCGRLGMVLGMACGLFGQVEDRPAAEWIRSGEPLKQAWAAHWIAEQRTERLVPEMLRVLGDPAAGTDAEAARMAILDALIQMHQEVAVADLGPLIGKFPTEVLILAARSHEEASAVLLRLLERPHNYAAFIAIGNLLTPGRDTGFALRALQEFAVRDEIMVFSPGQDQNIGGGWAGDSLGESDRVRPEWPETGTYSLIVGRSGGGELVASGRYTVSAGRHVGKTFVDHGFQEYGSEGGRTIPDRGQEFLADYLDVAPGKLPIHSNETLKITWAGEADFRSRVRGFFDGQRVRYATLVQGLMARKYVGLEDATALRLRILLWVSDERSGERTELPDLKELAGQ